MDKVFVVAVVLPLVAILAIYGALRLVAWGIWFVTERKWV